MGLFKSQEEIKKGQLSLRENEATNLYNNDVKQCLGKNNGRIHSIMLNVTSSVLEHNLGVDKMATGYIDTILDLMQEDGCVIVDVKFESVSNIGVGGKSRGFNVLITYK